MSEPKAYWPGTSEEEYGYQIYPIATDFEDSPGNYIYAKKNNQGKWDAVYIGQTSSLRDRFANHNKKSCILSHGATHIHVHNGSNNEQTRKAEEKDLIANCKPVCNDQHK